MSKTVKTIITHSELQTIKDCPQKHEYRYKIGWIGKTVGISTLFGSAIHDALEQFYLKNGIDEALKAVGTVFSRFFITNHDLPEWKLNEYLEAETLAVQVIRNYAEHYRDNDFEIAFDPISHRPMVEIEGLVPVYTPNGRASKLFLFAFKLDLVVVINDELWIVDHKTRADINDSIAERLVIDQQMRAYAWAASVYFGIPIAGVIYNIIRKKTPGEVKINKNGTVSIQKCDMRQEDYIDALERQDEYLCGLTPEERKEKKLACGLDFDAYAPEIKRLKDVRFFDRFQQRYNLDDLKSAQQEIYQASLMLHHCHYPYKNDAACDHWGGCQYRSLCMGLNPQAQERFTLADRKHTELDMQFIHPPRGRGFVIEEEGPEVMGMDGILDAVNA